MMIVMMIMMISFSELCWGMVMMAYAKPQQRKKEESKRLRGGRDQIKFIMMMYSCMFEYIFNRAPKFIDQ